MKQVFKIAAIANEKGKRKLDTQEIRKSFVCDENPKERIDHLVDEILNKKTVYRLGEEETIITLAVEACKQALKKAHLTSDQIDGIIFTGITREYYSPTTALVISHYLGCRNDLKCCIDTNANCIGMVTVMYQANAMMATDDEIQNLLLVDCGYLSNLNRVPDLVVSTSVSDTATAVILSRRETPAVMYFQGYQNAKQYNAAPAPAHGLTYFLRSKDFKEYGTGMNGDLDCEIGLVIEKIKGYLEDWQIKDIKAFCFSQYVYANILAITEGLQLDPKDVPYVADRFGYTGPSSPFLALNDKFEKGELNKEDRIFLWTVSTGSQHVFCSIAL